MMLPDSSHASNRHEPRAVCTRRPQPALRCSLAAAALWLVSTTCASAAPAALTALPAQIELSDAMPSVAMKVHNDGNAVMIVRLQPMAWVTDPVIDHYAPTADVQSTPPVFTLAPGATQQVRIDLVRPSGADYATKYQLTWQAVSAAAEPRS